MNEIELKCNISSVFTSEEFQQAVLRCLSVLNAKGFLQLSEIILMDKNQEKDTRLGATKKGEISLIYEKPFLEHKNKYGEGHALWELAHTILHEQYHFLNGAGEIEADEYAKEILNKIEIEQ